MPSLFGDSAFIKSSTGSAGTRASKLADIYLKGRTNSAGVITDPAAYDQAIAMLTPYADDLTVQKKIATLQNQQKAVQAKNVDQTITLSNFQRGVSQSLFSTNDGARDVSSLAFNTSVKLDDALTSINTAIETLKEQGKSTDQLETYRMQISKLANAQRDLVNKFNTGTADPSLDGFGYYVHTNPADGSILGAALLPVQLAPSEITGGLKRIQNTTKIGNSTLPVYVSANQLADGSYSAKVGGTVWVSDVSQKDLLVPDESGGIAPDASFDIKDSSKFPLSSASNSLKPGQFGRIVVGQDNGETKFAYFYKGHDNIIRNVDQASLDKLSADPILSKRLGGYVPLLNPDEVQTYQNVQPFNDQSVKTEGLWVDFQQKTADVAAAQVQQDSTNNLYDKAGDVLGRTRKAVGGFFSKIFKGGQSGGNVTSPNGQQTNIQTSPGGAATAVPVKSSAVNRPSSIQVPNQSVNGVPKANEIIDKGRGFFRNIA